MVCYIDFEANGVTQTKEIISIGAVAENGEKFYSLVRPHAKLDHKIKELTGIPQEEADVAPSIEEVMDSFLDWLFVKVGCKPWPKFYVFGHCDRDFVNGSIAVTDCPVTKERLAALRDNIEDTSKRIAKKFNRGTIGLRSAYLTMQLSSGEPIEQRHNALEDAEMLKYVWEHIDEYELPEGITPVKVPRPNMKYGKGKKKKKVQEQPSKSTKKEKVLCVDVDAPKTITAKSGVGRKKQAKRECPEIMNKKYSITFIARKGKRKPITFASIHQALPLVQNVPFTSGEQKLAAMEIIYNAVQTGEVLNGWRFTKVD